AVLAEALAGVGAVETAYLFGSWAARYEGVEGERPVGDIDLLVLGDPDREELYSRIDRASGRLGRQVQVTIRAAGWLTNGEGAFHDTIVNRPLVPVRTSTESSTGTSTGRVETG
ncbi:MAG: nucleotidyltransferase domain-containing protein, partial [Ilumatobacter sp.]|nr:nucleotidyltransferase domain-containing protein [Ilumatobacter sp.]